MAPHRFARSSLSRPTPLPEGRYAIPSTLPPTFGVHELFDWSSTIKASSSSSIRSASAGFSTFQRHWQKAKPSSSVTAWVQEQEDLVASRADTPSYDTPSIMTGPSDRLPFSSTPGSERPPSIFTSASERPEFAPVRQSPTPTKRSRVPSQLPTPNPSPLKLESGYPAPGVRTPVAPSIVSSTPSSKISSQPSAPSPVAPRTATRRSIRREKASDVIETSDTETIYSDGEDSDEDAFEEGEGELCSEDQSEEESEVESELNGDGRMRASRYIDDEARESRDTNRNKTRPRDNTNGVGVRWTVDGIQKETNQHRDDGASKVVVL
ncbi:hypothetical protein FRC08_007121 [Ceratobasidium sp. 394]|nr:hypothetical protein FRC08_007121 [Ceratobasidium sp. 394]